MLAQKLILSYGTKVIVQFMQIVASIIVARIAGPTVLGTIAFGLAFVSMFEFVADLGIGTAHVKLVSEGKEVGECISTFAVLKVLNTLIFVIIVLAAFLGQKFILNVRFESVDHEIVILITLAAVVVSQLMNIPIRTFAARMEQAKQDIPELVRTFIYQVLRIVIVLLGYKAVALALGNLAATLLIVPFVLYLFRKYPTGAYSRQLASQYFKISLPVLLMGMSTSMILYVDKVALQYFINSEYVGYYAAGYRIGALVYMIATSIGLLFLPLFSQAVAAGNLQYIKSIIERIERFSFVFIMPAVIFLSLFSDVIIRILLGVQYSPAVPVMSIINIAMFLMVLNMPYGNVLTGMGYFRLAALLNMINLSLFGILMFVLPNPRIFGLGITGMAITVLVSKIFIGVVYRVFAKRKCAILDLSRSMKFIIFGVLNYGLFYALYRWASESLEPNFRIAFIIVYFVVTYSSMWFLGWIDKSILIDLKELFNLKKMGRYILHEMRSGNSGNESH